MRLNYRRTIFVGLAFFSILAFWQMYDNIIPLILKNTFGLGDTISGFVMSLDNILALFMLPLFGALSDRVGRRMPFILAALPSPYLTAQVPSPCSWWYWGCCSSPWAPTVPPPWP